MHETQFRGGARKWCLGVRRAYVVFVVIAMIGFALTKFAVKKEITYNAESLQIADMKHRKLQSPIFNSETQIPEYDELCSKEEINPEEFTISEVERLNAKASVSGFFENTAKEIVSAINEGSFTRNNLMIGIAKEAVALPTGWISLVMSILSFTAAVWILILGGVLYIQHKKRTKRPKEISSLRN